MNNPGNNDRIIGIVGGMGPEAGGMLFTRILALTKANKDQDHLSVILMSLPKYIVDRTAFLEGREDSNPAFTIAGIVRKLEHAGATIIGIPCNTSHVPEIYDVLKEQLRTLNSRVQLLHMPDETCRYIRANHPEVKRVGVMSSNGAYRSGLYKDLLEEYGFEAILPDPEFQTGVINSIIYDPVHGIKANPDKLTKKARFWFAEAIRFFQDKRTEIVILGCTELSLIARTNTNAQVLLIDSTELLARSLIKEALFYEGTRI